MWASVEAFIGSIFAAVGVVEVVSEGVPSGGVFLAIGGLAVYDGLRRTNSL